MARRISSTYGWRMDRASMGRAYCADDKAAIASGRSIYPTCRLTHYSVSEPLQVLKQLLC
jgi:hypothetical protein